MARRKQEALSYDPIAVEQRVREREDYYQNLFLPMLVGIRNDLKWLVEGMIPKGFLVMLASPPKSGKTCLATAISLAVATGTPFAGHKTEQGAVLWISGEENPVERQLIYDHSPLADPATPIFTCYQKVNIEDEDFLIALGRWVRETRANLIVIDPLLACAGGRTLQDSWSARRTLQPLKDFCSLKGITALVLHHAKRGENYRGRRRVADNDQLEAASSMNIVLRSTGSLPVSISGGSPVDPDATPRLVTLHLQGRGVHVNRSFELLSYHPLDYRDTDQLEIKPERARDPDHSESKVLEALKNGPLDSEQIIAATGIQPSTARNAVTNLRRSGKIAVIQVHRRRRVYERVDLAQKLRNSETGELPEIPENEDYGYHPMVTFSIAPPNKRCDTR